MAEDKPRRSFLEPLDLSREGFAPMRDWIARLQSVLAAQNPAEIEEHLDLVRTAPGGIQDDWHFADPAMFSLLVYGVPGLRALYQLAAEDPLMAGFGAGHALVAAAISDATLVESKLWFAHRYLSRAEFELLTKNCRDSVSSEGVSSEARRLLFNLFQFYMADPFRRYHLGDILSHIDLHQRLNKGRERGSPATELVWNLMASATLSISEEVCNEATLLIQQNRPEKDYQAFFARHPALLDPMASCVIPGQQLAEMWKTDFVIRRLDDEYVFVEIEKPQDRPFTSYPQPSESLAHALAQVLNWFVWIEDNIAYAQSHGFPNIHSPRGVIVIGRDEGLDGAARRFLKTLNDVVAHRITIWTYDDVIRNARNVVRNLTAKRSGVDT